jgi:hypothetical protein
MSTSPLRKGNGCWYIQGTASEVYALGVVVQQASFTK